jgi:hypothetical protein
MENRAGAGPQPVGVRRGGRARVPARRSLPILLVLLLLPVLLILLALLFVLIQLAVQLRQSIDISK